MEEDIALVKKRDMLMLRHRELDDDIDRLAASADAGTAFELMRKKKERLKLRDELARIEETLYPDIIA